jgi:hypothetical protein
MEQTIYQATEQALNLGSSMYGEDFGKAYAEYIQNQLTLKLESGLITAEYAQTATLGDLIAGNDGE